MTRPSVFRATVAHPVIGRVGRSIGRGLRGILLAGAAACACAAVWSLGASTFFLWWTGLLHVVPPLQRPYAWFTYAPYFRRSMLEAVGIISGALFASLPFAALLRWQLARMGGWIGLTRRTIGVDRLVRGTTLNHGGSAWRSLEETRRLYPGACPILGGIVVGEADRVDLGPAAGLDFDPSRRSTWGNGGSAPLLIDQCRHGASHSLIISGSGGYKTTSLVTSILVWRKSRVVLDTSEELGPMLRKALEEDGQTVHILKLGSPGFNALSWIDPADPDAETNVYALVARITGQSAADNDKDAKNGIFRDAGKTIATALLMHLIWDEDIDPSLKTLRNLRAGLTSGQGELRRILRGIAARSCSHTASDLARSLMDIVDETFSGAYFNIGEATKWLSTENYAALVSGNTFNPADIVRGNMTVFLQIKLSALQENRGVARVIIGGLLNAIFEADGRVDGRVAFFIDEAVLLGPMRDLITARDQGRKYGVTLQLCYQSEAQIEEAWGKLGKAQWYDSVSFRSYGHIRNVETCRDLSTQLGTYGVQATSIGENTGKQSRVFEIASSSRGANTSRQEINRELMKPAELLQNMRADERITLPMNGLPIRHGVAIGFRRPEIAERLSDNRFAPGQARKPAGSRAIVKAD